MMLESEERRAIDKGMTTINIIWAAMFFSLIIYLFVGLFVKNIIQISVDEGLMQNIRNVLYILAIVTLIATKFIRDMVLKSEKLVQPQASSIQHPSLARYSSAMIVTLALSESIGIYGLVLVLLGKNTTDLYFMIFISTASMLYYRPKKEEVISLAKNLDR